MKNLKYILLLIIIMLNLLFIILIKPNYYLNTNFIYYIGGFSFLFSFIVIYFLNYEKLIKFFSLFLCAGICFLNFYSFSLLSLKYYPKEIINKEIYAGFYQTKNTAKNTGCNYNMYIDSDVRKNLKNNNF